MYDKVLLKVDGEVQEISVSELDMDPVHATDAQILTAVVEHPSVADRGVTSLNEYVVERGETVVNLRPTATFG